MMDEMPLHFQQEELGFQEKGKFVLANQDLVFSSRF
jgi:hypothetical protein